MRERLRRIDLRGAIGVLCGAVVVLLPSWTSRDAVGGPAPHVIVEVLLFLVAIALGETARLTILTGRETAPMSTAAALGLSFTALAAARRTRRSTPRVVVATISLGMVPVGC